MSNENELSPKSGSPDTRFAEKLKREATANRPPFSAELHDRIMTAIVASGRLHGAEPLVTLAQKGGVFKRAIQWSAITAAIVIGIIATDQFRPGGETPPNVVVPIHGSDHVAVVQPTRGEVSFDDLDHTAGIALRLVVDQLPIEVPADEWGLPTVN
jgi:hypothetical protein